MVKKMSRLISSTFFYTGAGLGSGLGATYSCLGAGAGAGFGLGFERLILFVTGMQNIRDVIPFPRTPKNAEF